MCQKRFKDLYSTNYPWSESLLQQTVLYPTFTRDNTVYINTMLQGNKDNQKSNRINGYQFFIVFWG